MRNKRLDHCHFSDFLLNDKAFKEFAMLSMGGESEDWFRKLSEGMKAEEEKKFDDTCQSLMADIWGCLRNSHCNECSCVVDLLSTCVEVGRRKIPRKIFASSRFTAWQSFTTVCRGVEISDLQTS
jgi:hypothetical protein